MSSVSTQLDCQFSFAKTVEGGLEFSINNLHNRMTEAVKRVLFTLWTADGKPICPSPVRENAIACDRLQLAALLQHLRKIGVNVTQFHRDMPSSFQPINPLYGTSIGFPSNTMYNKCWDKIVSTFMNTKDPSSALPGNHTDCSPFQKLFRTFSKWDPAGLDLWKLRDGVPLEVVLYELPRHRHQQKEVAALIAQSAHTALNHPIANSIKRAESFTPVVKSESTNGFVQTTK